MEALAQECEGQDEEPHVAGLTTSLRDQYKIMQQRLSAVEGRALPSAVLCRASQKAHKVTNVWTTACGWAWASNPAAAQSCEETWAGSWCKACLRATDRQVGGRA